jgi:alcohol dehydrogenase (cytochrome c)
VKKLMTLAVAVLLLTASYRLDAQVTSDRILRAADEPQNWLTYSGGYSSQRYSLLKQIDTSNAKNLELKWMVQNQVFGPWETSPLVVDGIMYLTQRPNDVMAVDAKTGRMFWLYRYTNSGRQQVCCGAQNRGVAMLGDTLFMGTLDAHLVAIDAKNGKPLWTTLVADDKLAYSITLAPLVVKDKVIVGVGGAEYGIRGFVAAYDPKNGKELWRFYTIPGQGEKGSETWSGQAWEHGGGSVWVTGSYDPALNLTYWGVGNPGPDWNPDQRPGDNLYTDSVVALDADTGKLKWHYQFTPNDGYDYDSVQVPVLADLMWKGTLTKAMLWGNRNGNFYVLDRENGKFLLGAPFVKVTWMSGWDEGGKPIQTPQPVGMPTYPGVQGGTNWYSPSYSPRTGLFYLSAWENYGSIYRKEPAEYEAGRRFNGGTGATVKPVPDAPVMPGPQAARSPINTWTNLVGNGAVIAIDPKTGQAKWKFQMYDVTDAGILTTAGDVLFTGGREGYFYALDARTGTVLWKTYLGGAILSAPVTYSVDGKQYVIVNAGNVMATFALRE